MLAMIGGVINGDVVNSHAMVGIVMIDIVVIRADIHIVQTKRRCIVTLAQL